MCFKKWELFYETPCSTVVYFLYEQFWLLKLCIYPNLPKIFHTTTNCHILIDCRQMWLLIECMPPRSARPARCSISSRTWKRGLQTEKMITVSLKFMIFFVHYVSWVLIQSQRCFIGSFLNHVIFLIPKDKKGKSRSRNCSVG